MPQEEEVVDVLAYLRRLTRYLVPALVAGLVVAGLLGWRATQQKPTYAQKAHVLVYPNVASTEAVATQQTQLLGMMMRTYVALEDAPVFTEAVSQATGGKWTPEQVATDLTIYWGGGSNLLAFQSTASSLDDANELANAGADVFVKKAAQMAPNDPALWSPKLQVVERSAELNPPTSASSGLVTALGAGVVTALLVMLLLEALSAARRRRGGPSGTGQPTLEARTGTAQQAGASRARKR